jgi:hypothetical protein
MYQPDLTIAHQPLASQQQDIQQEQQQKTFDLNTALATEKLVQEHYNTMDARDKSRLRSVSIAAAQVKPFLDAGDTEGALAFAKNRQRQLHARMGTGENIDDEDTQAFIDYLEKGDIQTAKGMVDSTISLGFMTGTLKPSENGTSAMERTISKLMAENPDLTYSGALYQYQTGNRQGTQLDENGNVVPITGALDVKKEEEKSKASGKKEGELITEAKANLPRVLDNAETTLSVLDKALNAKGIAKNFGVQGLIPNMPGGDAANAQALLDQIKGGAFLQAFETLKGGGQITEVEGEKATNAITRMQSAQSFEAFQDAAEDYKSVINKGIRRAKIAASGSNFNQNSAQPAANQPAAGTTIDWNSF